MAERDLTRVIGGAALLALLALAGLAVAETFLLRLPAEISLNYGEGFVQIDAERAARGAPIYGDPAEVPWTLHVYPPLYTWLVAACLRAGAEGYTAGRLIGYLALIATALLVAGSGRDRSGRLAWAVAAVYLTLPLFVPWGALVRPDNLAVLFSSLGVLVVDRHIGRSGRPGLVWAAPLFLAAGLSKQSVAAGLVAAVLVLALRDRRGLLRFGAVFVAGGLAAVAALQLGTDGRFWLHTLAAHADKPFSWARAWSVERSFLAMDAPSALFGAALLAWVAVRRRLSIQAIWLVVAAFSTLAAGASGSDTNYFLEPAAALAFLAARELRWPGPEAARGLRIGATAGAGIAVACAAWNVRIHHLNHAWIPAAERSFEAAADRWGAELAGPVIADDAGFLVATGAPLHLRPFIITQLASAGAWDEAPLLDAIRRGAIALFVLQRQPPGIHESRYTPAVRAAIARHYARADTYRTDFEYEIYVPREPRGR